MTEKFGSGRFCSRSCSNSKELTDDVKDKIRKTLLSKNHRDVMIKKKNVEVKKETYCRVCLTCGVPLSKTQKSDYCKEHLVEHTRQLKLERWLLTGDIGLKPDTTIRGVFRDYIAKQQNNVCDICGQSPMWNNKPLTFILDHIDGDASNSCRENLRLICPNCDSQLDTYKSKNKHSARTSRKNKK